MQPFQCDLQPQLQEPHRTTHTGATILAKHIGGTIRDRNDPSRTRRTDEVPFIVACSHFTRKNTRFRALASSQNNIAHATFMQPFQCDLQPQLQEPHRSTHTGATILAKHIGGTIRDRNDPSRTRRTDEVPFIVACSHFTRKNTRFRALASSPQHCPCNIHAAIPMRSATSDSIQPPTFFPFVTSSLLHHFPSSPLPFIITSLLHHSPSSSLPFFTTPLHHHFPSSPLPFIITSLLHHSPSSSLPFFTTPLHHHFPSSPLPFIITSLLHHSPSSSLPFFTTSPSRSPPFIIVSSFLMY